MLPFRAGGPAPGSAGGGVKWYEIVIPIVGALLLATVAVLALFVARRRRHPTPKVVDGKGPYEVRAWGISCRCVPESGTQEGQARGLPVNLEGFRASGAGPAAATWI